MVPLNAGALLEARIVMLDDVVAHSLPLASDTSIGFANVVLRRRPGFVVHIGDHPADLDYGGIPTLARAGFLAILGSDFDAAGFARAADRLRGRPKGGRDQLHDDDLALLGIATGIAADAGAGLDRRKWLLDIANDGSDPTAWSHRARQLAADLLDGAGRLRADPRPTVDALAVDLVLRDCWPEAFATVAPIVGERRQDLMAALLSSPAPAKGELERAAIWLAALNLLVRRVSAELVPNFDTLFQTLQVTQSAFRRWVWDAKPNRGGIGPARWLIDTEAHVQAFLWAILEPRFGDQLVDEQYLPGFGQKQPRFDFGVTALKTIVEVKIARNAGDFSRIEEEVAGDLGLYFSDLARFDRMIVYVYDDSDSMHPERYDTLRSALQKRDTRIGGVVFVQRPGMLPVRGARQPWSTDKSE